MTLSPKCLLRCLKREILFPDRSDLVCSESLLVDMAGSAAVLGDLHHHYRENMKHSCRIGATHYEEMGAVDHLPGATPEFFFAPSHIQTRSAELGAVQLMMSMGLEYVAFRAGSDKWLKPQRRHGIAAVEQTYQAVLAGKADAASGQIVSMWPTI